MNDRQTLEPDTHSTITTHKYPYVIVGGGAAACGAVRTFAEQAGHGEGQLAIVSANKGLGSEATSALKQCSTNSGDIASKLDVSTNFFAEHGFKTYFNTNILDTDTYQRVLHLDNGVILNYDHLLLATGSKPIRSQTLPPHFKNVYYRDTLDTFLRTLLEASSSRKVTLIGSQMVHLEIASYLRDKGHNVTMIAEAPHPLQNILPPQCAETMQALLITNGVEAYFGVHITETSGQKKVKSLQLSNGEQVETDIIFVEQGTQPDLSFISGEPTRGDSSKGIRVDQNLTTCWDSVWAAGEVAYTHDQISWQHYSLQSADIAYQQGAYCALQMMGKRHSLYPGIPEQTFSLFQRPFILLGNISDADDCCIENDPDNLRFAIWWYRQKTLIAGCFFNCADANLVKQARDRIESE